MAAKSKKRQRLSKIENKLLKLEKLELKDVFCSICHSILVEPVTLPCYHDFCLRCFNGSVENNALCCPLCRLRIGSWLRTATKQKNLVNVDLWNFIKFKFSREIDIKTKGEDIHLPEELPPAPQISAPGEIRLEYENELRRLRAERLELEQKHLQQTELLIKKIQEEEEEAHRKYLEAVKRDELLAQEMQHEQNISTPATAVRERTSSRKQSLRSVTKPRLKATKIDGYLSKVKATIVKDSPLLTDDNTSTDNSTPKEPSVQCNNGGSPELIPSYGKSLKNFLNKKMEYKSNIWNKENGDSIEEKKVEPEVLNSKEDEHQDKTNTKSNAPQSLLVSLPLPQSGILQQKSIENRSIETGSVDSMRQELCYFKPIEATTPTGFTVGKGLPLRIPSVRAEQESSFPGYVTAPTQDQYLEGLCRLRHLSIAKNLPSAFVVLLNGYTFNKNHIKCETNTRQRVKKHGVINSQTAPILPVKRCAPNRSKPTGLQTDGIMKQKPEKNLKRNLRRTRSMGSMSKDENETTPKKAKLKERKVASERRPYLRSDSKKSNAKKEFECPSPIPETINNNKINLAVKNLSSPLKNCDLKNIVNEQLRIEKLIEQEKNDLEIARKIDAEWNSRRHLRRAPVKRQVTLSYALRPAKKLKV
ncbi:uncharacterized protein LOC106136975 isoform X1 [Amyelois transitella]|uniref:uncharacterized protein LOC106136975 isoform X1 n=1 Tax=Amyelois transitella TaxID=680683 RepID=UPI0029900674|nr:uncharacterized protein LOC106136975 isoform X1 [Amyelois transitella]